MTVTDKLPESIESSKFVSSLESLIQGKIVKLSFRELCDSKLFGLHSFDNMAIVHCVK